MSIYLLDGPYACFDNLVRDLKLVRTQAQHVTLGKVRQIKKHSKANENRIGKNVPANYGA
jgi:hypothetical protein